MGSMQSETTLDMVIKRLTTLEDRNVALEEELASLRGKRPIIRAMKEHPQPSRTEHTTAHSGTTSRRTWLKRAAGAAVASVAAGAMVQRDTDTASAHHGSGWSSYNAENVIAHHVEGIGSYTHGVIGEGSSVGVRGRGPAGVTGSSTTTGADGFGVIGYGNGTSGRGVKGFGTGSGAGVEGENLSKTGPGVYGRGRNGVVGESSTDNWTAVAGVHSGEGYGVAGQVTSVNTPATQGANYGSGPGVRGLNINNLGVGVQGVGNIGVRGDTTTAGSYGVYGSNNAGGHAVGGNTTSTSRAGVYGSNFGAGPGVTGVAANGYGGQFQGGKAQLKLIPSGTTGRPTTGAHTKGELFMDSAANLYVCTVSGTPGTWRRVSTIAT